MKKPVLKMFKQVEKLHKETVGIVDELRDHLESRGTEIRVGKLVIDQCSSLKQYLYAVGILSSQIAAAVFLGEEEEADSLKETLDKVIKMRASKKEYDEWYRYRNQIFAKKEALHKLLSNEEKASLIEIPNPPSGFEFPKCFNKKK